MRLSELILKADNNFICGYLLGCIYSFPCFIKMDDDQTDYSKIVGVISYKPEANLNIKEIINERKLKINFEIETEKLNELLLNKVIKETRRLGITVKSNSEMKLTRKAYGGVSFIVDNDIFEGEISESKFFAEIEKRLMEIKTESFYKSFMIGVFDSRGSLDFSRRLIALDLVGTFVNGGDDLLDNAIKLRKKSFLHVMSDGVSIVKTNFNPRFLQPNSTGKNDQFRLRMDDYMYFWGLFTPFKMFYYLLMKEIKYDFRKLEGTEVLTIRADEEAYTKDSVILDRSMNEDILAFENQLNRLHLSEERKCSLMEQFRIKKFETDIDEIGASTQLKIIAKERSSYKCEFNEMHSSFIAQANRRQYVEAHHLIPFARREEYKGNIDVLENLICLCPNCHRKIHHGIRPEIQAMLGQLLNQRRSSLIRAGIEIDDRDLMQHYL